MKAGSSHVGGAEAELEVLLLLCTTAATLLCGQKRREKKTQDSKIHQHKIRIRMNVQRLHMKDFEFLVPNWFLMVFHHCVFWYETMWSIEASLQLISSLAFHWLETWHPHFWCSARVALAHLDPKAHPLIMVKDLHFLHFSTDYFPKKVRHSAKIWIDCRQDLAIFYCAGDEPF